MIELCRFFCVHLSSATDRRLHMEAQFEKIGRSDQLTFVDALAADSPYVQDYYGVELSDTPAVVACFASHLKALRVFVEESSDTYAVICEDDICFRTNFNEAFAAVVENLPDGCPLVALSYWHERAELAPTTWSGKNPSQHNLAPLGDTAGALLYLVSRTWAIDALERFDRPFKDIISPFGEFKTSELITLMSDGLMAFPLLAIERTNNVSLINPGDPERIAKHERFFERWGLENFHIDTKPLLGLVMIVRQEVHGIRATLETFKPFIDHYSICDTGSTDGTQDIIREVLAGIPGKLYEEPFIDFAASRNRVLDLHGDASTFTIMPDSDDRLVRGEILRAFLEIKREGKEDCFAVNLRRGDLSYWLTLVLRTKARRRYRGRVHEYVEHQGGAPAQIPAVQLTQVRPAQSTEASRKRWERDLGLLQADLDVNPNDARALFYLAQTYECLGRPEDALLVYKRRIEAGGWDEETFEAKFRCAKILHSLERPWPETQEAYLDAHQFSPQRAEPLFKIAEYWYGKGEHALAYLFAHRAAALPRPNARLFVDEEVYTWKAADICAISGYYLNDIGTKREGAKMAERVVKLRPGDERVRANWAFYAPPAAELFPGYRSQPIDFIPKKPYVANNPSIAYDAVSKVWRCVVRTTNYQIINGQYITPDNNVIYTRNFMLELNDDLSTKRAIEMIDKTDIPRSSYPVHGFEDCRLFERDGALFCSSTVCDFDLEKSAEGPREIVLVELDAEYSIVTATPLRGPWSRLSQKNWMPTEDGRRLVYSAAPMGSAPATVFGLTENRTIDTSATFFGHGRLRGGSQLVVFDGGWLCIVHDVAWPGGNSRIYLHRFVKFDVNFKIVSMSSPFFFEKKGVEFCAGLAYSQDRLVASFGVEDRVAHFGIFDPADVRARLKPDFVI